MACTRAIIDAKGVVGLYAGFWPFLIQSAAKSSVRFYSFELIANAVDRLQLGDRKANPGFWALVCGLGAGTVESLALTAPTDRVKVLSQALSAQKGGVPITAAELIRERVRPSPRSPAPAAVARGKAAAAPSSASFRARLRRSSQGVRCRPRGGGPARCTVVDGRYVGRYVSRYVGPFFSTPSSNSPATHMM